MSYLAKLADKIREEVSLRSLAESYGVVFKRSAGDSTGLCCFHEDGDDSFSLYDGGRKWKCFTGCGQGSVIDLYMFKHGLEFKEAVLAMREEFGIEMPEEPDNGDYRRKWPYYLKGIEVWTYGTVDGLRCDEVRFPVPPKKGQKPGKKGSVFFVHEKVGLRRNFREGEYVKDRYGVWVDPKNQNVRKGAEKRPFPQRCFPLFRPDRWMKATKDAWIWLMEGPKDADTMHHLGFFATTSACGAGTLNRPNIEELQGRRVVVLYDNDTPGKRGSRKHAEALAEVAAEVRLIEPLGKGKGYDVTDFRRDLRKDGVSDKEIAERLEALLKSATPIGGEDMTATDAAKLDPDYRYTDTANAEQFARDHGQRFVHVGNMRSWFEWQENRYAKDIKGASTEAAKGSVLRMIDEAAGLDGDEGERLRTHGLRSLSTPKISHMLTAAKTHPDIARKAEEFDADPWKLNTENGILDLDTGDFEEHREGFYPRHMKVTGCPHMPRAAAPSWEQFLRDTLVREDGDPDPDLIGYIQRALGYSLIGAPYEEVLLLMWGEGANGKTMFIDTVSELFGLYSQSLQFDALLRRRGGGDPKTNNPDVADLHGSRIAWAVESGPGSVMNEPLLKLLTGSDKIKAARKYENPIQFDPSHTLWLATNNLPRVFDRSKGFWRRVAYVPWRVEFTSTPEKHDPLQRKAAGRKELTASLRQELPGILNWCLAGLEAWKEDGLGSCEAIRAETEKYRAAETPLLDFITTQCYRAPDELIPMAQLRQAYLDWCGDENEEPTSAKGFNRCLEEIGMKRGKTDRGKTRVWRGIRLLLDGESAQSHEEEDLPF